MPDVEGVAEEERPRGGLPPDLPTPLVVGVECTLLSRDLSR